MEEQKKEYTGVWLPAFIVEDRTLPPNAKLLYAEIAGFKQCFASNTFFANRLGLTVRGVQKNLVLLQASGYVVVTEQKGKRILTVVRDELRFTPPRTQVHPPMNSGSYIDIHIDNNKKKDNTSASPTDSGTGQGEAQGLESVPRRCKIHSSQPNRDCPSCSTDQRKLFDSLVQELGLSRAAFSAERRAKLKNRLKEFSADEMITAAKNIKKDPFMQGKNERKKFYGTMEYLLRNDGNVEKWLVAAEAPRKAIF